MTDLDLGRALAELPALRSDDEPIVTLYLATRWSDEKQRERARLFVQEGVRRALARHADAPQGEALERTLRRVAQVAAEHHGQASGHGQAADRGGQGLAVFACEALQLWRVLVTPGPLKDELAVDSRPHLLQLARMANDLQPAVVVFVHGRGAELYELSLGLVVNETRIEHEVPREHGEGGRVGGGASASPDGASGAAYYERDQKNQRRLDEQAQKAYRDAGHVLRQLWEREPRTHLILSGTSEALGDFERQLPERLRERIVTRLPRPRGRAWDGAGKHVVATAVVRALVERGRRTDRLEVEHAIGEARRGGMAVVGPEDVVLAVNERRVHRLLLEEDFDGSGWRCRNCGALGTTHDEVCAFCGGPLARVDALGEEIAGRVLADDGEVEVVPRTRHLHSYDGVAALLREAKPKGLAGRGSEAPRS